jgi:hypothetical protein
MAQLPGHLFERLPETPLLLRVSVPQAVIGYGRLPIYHHLISVPPDEAVDGLDDLGGILALGDKNLSPGLSLKILKQRIA